MTQTPGNMPGTPGSQTFNPDQFKQDLLNEVQNLLNTFAQQQQPPPVASPGYAPLPPGFPGYPPQQQQFIPNGPVVNATLFPQPGQMQPGQMFGLQPPQPQPGQQFGLVPPPSMQSGQYPLVPYGQQPTIEQFFQCSMGVLQRQEQLILQMQELIARGQAAPSAPVGPPYPFGSRVEQYVWLFDWGLQYNDDGTAKPQVTYADINTRRARLDTLHQALTWHEKDILTSRGYLTFWLGRKKY